MAPEREVDWISSKLQHSELVRRAMELENGNSSQDDCIDRQVKRQKKSKFPSESKAGRWTDSERRTFLVGLQRL